MKIIVHTLLLLSLIHINLKTIAGEFSGAGSAMMTILKRQNIDFKYLKNSGHILLFGENTGAGMSLNLSRIKYIMTKNKAYSLNDVTHINYKHPSRAKSLNDIKALEFNREKIINNQIKGLIIKK